MDTPEGASDESGGPYYLFFRNMRGLLNLFRDRPFVEVNPDTSSKPLPNEVFNHLNEPIQIQWISIPLLEVINQRLDVLYAVHKVNGTHYSYPVVVGPDEILAFGLTLKNKGHPFAVP